MILKKTDPFFRHRNQNLLWVDSEKVKRLYVKCFLEKKHQEVVEIREPIDF